MMAALCRVSYYSVVEPCKGLVVPSSHRQLSPSSISHHHSPPQPQQALWCLMPVRRGDGIEWIGGFYFSRNIVTIGIFLVVLLTVPFASHLLNSLKRGGTHP